MEEDQNKNKKIDALKQEFVSIISHQMRTPLSATKWNLEALLENKKGNKLNDWQQAKLRDAYQSNERMINLVDDIMNLSQIDEGRIQLNLDKVDLSILCREIAQQNAIFAKANNIVIKVEIDEQIPAVKGDRHKLAQVIDNLINNAIKYTQGKGVITISARIEGSAVVFSLTDQGIGIPPAAHERVFEKFFRAPNAVSNQTDGTGLGLYVVQKLIQAHGGRIWFESELGQGTTFYFNLPIYK